MFAIGLVLFVVLGAVIATDWFPYAHEHRATWAHFFIAMAWFSGIILMLASLVMKAWEVLP